MDTNLNSRAERLAAEILSLKKSYEILLMAIDADGVSPARDIADRLADRLDAVIREIKGGFAQDVLDERFRPFSEDRTRLLDRAGSDDFLALVSRLEKHIALVDREMHALHPMPSRIGIWAKQNRRVLALGLGLAAIVVFGVTGVRSYLTRGKGLVGEYYKGVNFRELVKRRRDLTIDFAFRNAGPMRSLGAENYSVRWTGFLRVPNDGQYELLTRSDDGVRLWIDNELIIDNWNVHRSAMDKAVRPLTAGFHPIKLEWYQRRGPATIRLFWRAENDVQPLLVTADFLSPTLP